MHKLSKPRSVPPKKYRKRSARWGYEIVLGLYQQGMMSRQEFDEQVKLLDAIEGEHLAEPPQPSHPQSIHPQPRSSLVAHNSESASGNVMPLYVTPRPLI